MFALPKTPPLPANDAKPIPPRYVTVNLQTTHVSPRPHSMWAALATVLVFCSGAAGMAFGFLQHQLHTEAPPPSQTPVVIAQMPTPPVKIAEPTAQPSVVPSDIVLPAPEPENTNPPLPETVASQPVAAASEPEPAFQIALHDSPPSDLDKAHTLLTSGHEDAALTLYEKTLKHDPANAVAQAALAKIMIRQGHASEALPHLDRAARESPENMLYRLDLAILYDRLGNAANALTLYRQILGHATGLNLAQIETVKNRAAYLTQK